MKRFLCIIISFLLFLGLFSNIAFAEKTNNEIPSIYITGELAPFPNKRTYTSCSVTFKDRNGNTVAYDENAVWRRHGNSTSNDVNFSKKCPYKIKLSSNQNLYNMGSADSWVLLANFFDPTLLRNKLVLDFAADIGMPYVSKSIFVDLYVNDEYRGNYLLVEPVEIDDERVDIFPAANEFVLELNIVREYYRPVVRTTKLKYTYELNSIDYLPDSQRTWLMNFLDEVEDALMALDRTRITEIIDVDSFIDTFILYELVKDYDMSGASVRYYIKENKLYAGPVWDFDLALGNSELDSINWYASQYLYWKYLTQSEWFCRAVEERYVQLKPIIDNIYEDNELGKNRIDSLTDSMPESIKRNNAIWDISRKNFRIQREPEATYKKMLNI